MVGLRGVEPRLPAVYSRKASVAYKAGGILLDPPEGVKPRMPAGFWLYRSSDDEYAGREMMQLARVERQPG